MLGWRGRVGLVVPTNNTVIEPEFYAERIEGVSFHAARMEISGQFTVENVHKMAENCDHCLEEFNGCNVDLIVYCCLSTSLIKGESWDREFRDRCRTEAFTAGEACKKALAGLGRTKVAFFSPYPPEVKEPIRTYFQGEGIEIVKNVSLEIRDLNEVGEIVPERLYRFVVDHANSGEDVIFILSTDIETLRACDYLQRDLKKPVVSTNRAILWTVSAALDLAPHSPKRGRRFGV